MKRSQWMKQKHAALQKVADDAHAKFIGAEDLLADLDAREARRSQRSAQGASVPAAWPLEWKGGSDAGTHHRSGRSPLADLAMSDNAKAAAEAQINEAKAKATTTATTAVDGYLAEAQERWQPISADLCAARDGYADLAKQARLGHLSPREKSKRMNELRQTQWSAVTAVEDVAATAERVEQIEADPLAYGEHIFNNTPAIRPTFDF